MPDPDLLADGHPHARAVLTAALPPAGRPSHAYLFHGPPGAGKAATARAFAAALIAEGTDDPADQRRRALEGVHPDLTWVRPTGANEMRVSDVDEPVVAAATRTPFESRRRVFVLERVETMNDQAANRMLKTLEEPAPYAHLVLLADRVADVLPTILSRCLPVRFEAPTAAQLAERLGRHGVAPAQAKACGRLALGDGRLALALALGEGPALRSRAEALGRATIAGRLASRPWLGLLTAATEEGERAAAAVEERLEETLGYLPAKEHARARREAGEAAKRAGRRARTRALDEQLMLCGLWLRDVACVVDGAEELVHHADRVDQVREDAERFAAPHGLRSAVGLVDETRFALAEVNASEELALEALAFRVRAALAA